MEKGEIAQNEQFHLFSTMFSMQSVSYNPLIVTFQFSSAASMNLGWSQNEVLGNGLSCWLSLLAGIFVEPACRELDRVARMSLGVHYEHACLHPSIWDFPDRNFYIYTWIEN